MDALIEANMYLVQTHIRMKLRLPRQPSSRGDYDDLYQEGCMALVIAARRYDPRRHGPWTRYARYQIRYAISRLLYEGFRAVRIPAAVLRELRRTGQVPVETECPDDLGNHSVAWRHRPSEPTIGDLWVSCYQQAAYAAADDLKRSPRCQPDRARLIVRFVEEYLLVPEASARTPKRDLARQEGCSVGRINGVERQLVRAIIERLDDDAEATELRRRARGADGWRLLTGERCE